MADESCDLTQTGPQSRYAAEWGLATLLLAGFQVIAAFLTMILATTWLVLLNSGNAGDAILVPAAIIAAVTLVFWASCVGSIVAGRHSIRAAWARCQPGGLPLAGTLLAIVAFVLWSAIGLGLALTFFYVVINR